MNKAFSLKGKKIVVTGASSGIGRSVAVQCSRAGADVLLIARNESELDRTLGMMEAGNHAKGVMDLGNYSLYADVLAPFAGEGGTLFGLVHSAGLEFSGPYNMTKPQNYQQLFNINAVAGFEMARVITTKFSDPGTGGSFVFISSIRALFGQEGASAYSASKGALVSGARSLALELSRKNIRVNSISPSLVMTPMLETYFNSLPDENVKKIREQHPLGLGRPEDVSNLCIYLLSDESRWMTGNNIVLDGGYSVR